MSIRSSIPIVTSPKHLLREGNTIISCLQIADWGMESIVSRRGVPKFSPSISGSPMGIMLENAFSVVQLNYLSGVTESSYKELIRDFKLAPYIPDHPSFLLHGGRIVIFTQDRKNVVSLASTYILGWVDSLVSWFNPKLNMNPIISQHLRNMIFFCDCNFWIVTALKPFKLGSLDITHMHTCHIAFSCLLWKEGIINVFLLSRENIFSLSRNEEWKWSLHALFQLIGYYTLFFLSITCWFI